MDADTFKAPAPKVGSTKNKRKAVYDFTPDPSKRPKNADVTGANGKGKQRGPTMEDLPDEEDGVERLDYTPSHERADAYDFAPNGDADYFAEEDVDGRFFGGGLTGEQKEIMDILEQGEGEGEAGAEGEIKPLDLQGVRKQLLGLEKAINKNREMRTRFANDPNKFVDSEFALTEAIQRLALLTQDPGLYYPELIRLSIVPSLSGLLSHENIDIGIAVIEMLEELTDDDVLEGEEPDDDEDAPGPSDAVAQTKGREALRGLLDSLLENQLLELLVDNLARLNETEDTERNGVFHSLGLIENLVSAHPDAARLLISSSPLATWLLSRLQQKSTGDGLQNKYYAMEILAILVQSETANRLAVVQAGGVDILLGAISTYRKRDPVDADELEFMENLFDGLCSLLLEPATKARFLEGEGVELMVILMKAKMLARTRSIKVLDHACAGEEGSPCCEKLVEAGGLKTMFSVFMGKGQKSGKNAATTAEDTEHALGIINSLLFNLESDSHPRVRLLAKFVEEDYEKVDRLVELREQIGGRVRAREGELDRERQVLEGEGLELDEVDGYLRRLDAGLFSLQLADTILAFVCMEDDGVRDHARMLLRRRDRSFSDVVKVLKEYRDNIGDQVSGVGGMGGSPSKAAEDKEQESPGQRQKDALGHLMAYLSAA